MADEKKTVKVTADIDIQTNAQQIQKARAEIAALNREIEDLKIRLQFNSANIKMYFRLLLQDKDK